MMWDVRETYYYRTDGPPKPHMIASLVSGVRSIGANQGLTVHEVRAIVHIMVNRVNHRAFRKFHIHPVSHSGPCY